MARRLVAALAALLLLAVAGCSGDVGADKQTLRVAYNARPPTLDPLMSTATATQVIMRNVFEGLVAPNTAGQVQPMIAESWTVSPDQTTFTFRLRRGVKFHNGDPVRAEDVVASIERWIKVTTTGKGFFKDAKVRAVDDATVEVKTVKPLFTGLRLLSDTGQLLAIMPKKVIDQAGPSGVKEFIGTGPYRFEEWKADSYVRMTGNKDYAPVDAPADGMAGRREAAFAQMFFYFVSDPSTRLSGLQTGEYDAVTSIPPDNADFVKGDKHLQVVTSPNGFNGAIFNKAEGVMADVRMRRAVAAAMNPKDIQTAAFADPEYYTLNGALMTPEQKPYYSDKGVDQVYDLDDPALARRYLQEAGYRGQPIRILTSREYDDHYNGAVVLREQLRNAGMNAELAVYDWPTVLQRRTDPKGYEIFITGFSLVTVPNQFVFLNPTWPGWTKDPGIASAMDRINASKTEAEAAKASEELQVAVNDYLPMAKYGEKMNITALRSNVVGYSWYNGDIFATAHKV